MPSPSASAASALSRWASSRARCCDVRSGPRRTSTSSRQRSIGGEWTAARANRWWSTTARWKQHRRFWTPQARELLSRREAIALATRAFTALSGGSSCDRRAARIVELDATATPVDGRALSAELAAEYDVRRRDATERTWRELSRPRGMLASVADLDASYDQTHLVTCTASSITRHVPEDERGSGRPYALCRPVVASWSRRRAIRHLLQSWRSSFAIIRQACSRQTHPTWEASW